MNEDRILVYGSKEDVIKGLNILEKRYGKETPLVEVIKDLDKKNE